jgi:hypothetical protein
MKYIYHHLGLGDHIVCNGLVRSLITDDESFSIFVKEHNYPTVKFMYRDIPNLNCIVGNDFLVEDLLRKGEISQYDIIKSGFGGHPEAKSFDECFYLHLNVPFEKRWDSFKVSRDINSEIEIFKKFNISEKNYIFIHDDGRFPINIKKINNPHNLPIIKCSHGLTENIFDFCYTIENAFSFHSIESSLQFMVDSLNLSDDNNVHRYARPLPPWEIPKYRTVKNIIL